MHACRRSTTPCRRPVFDPEPKSHPRGSRKVWGAVSSRFTALLAEQPQEVLVQLEPKRVIAFDLGAAHPLDLAAFCALQSFEQSDTVIGKARHDAFHPRQQRLRALVQLTQAIQNLSIVIAVRMI